MRNLTLLFAIFLMASFSLFAQKGVIHLSSAEDEIKLNENTMEKLELVFNHSIIQSFTVTTKAGTFDEIAIPGAKFTGKIGEPKIPAYSELIEVPFGAEVKVIVKNYTTEEYDLGEFGINNPIIPAQPSISKSEDPEKVKFYYNESAYQSRSFTDFEMATVTTLGTMRGVRIAKLSVSPVNYNPAEGKIRVYNDIEVEVVFEKANKNMTETIQASTYSPYFEPVYNTLLNHKNVIDDHPDLTKYPVKMLILSDRMFEDALEPYIAWKTKKGFEVIVNYTDEGYSTVQDIKDWIIGHYNAGTEEDPAPSFCLFVGDVDQIPESQTGTQSGKATDLYYFSQDGDYFPEMYYGRMSANNLTELQPQIDKTLYYEQYQFEDPTYLDDVTLIAGADGTWNPRVGQPTVNYGTENYFNTSHGYSTVNAYLSSYSGCYDNERISVSFINYTAHCSQGGWGDPNLSISDVYAMTNTNKYPLAVGNCCLSADFGYSGECVGEAWVRAENKGAVAYIGSSPSSYWFEDFYWSVGAFPISGTNDGYVPTVEETTMGVYDAMFMGDYKTTSALVFLGNLAVTEVDVEGYPQHSSPTYYWEAYNVLGDPSLVAYKKQGSQNIVSHGPTMPIGQTIYDINAEPGSYVAISKDGILHGAGLVDETGTIQLDIEPIQSSGSVDIVVTKPQFEPYITTVPAAAINGAYIVIDSCANTIDYGQSINMDIALKNVGNETASGVTAMIFSDDPNLTITNYSYSYGDISADSTTDASAGAFTVQAANNLEDQYQAIVNVAITDDNGTFWNQSKTITVNAPVFEIGEMTLTNDDDANGRLDPGETAEINFSVNNVGHADASGVVGTLSGDSPYFTIMDMTIEADITASGSAVFTFNVEASTGAPQGSPVNLDFDVALNDYTDVTTEAIVIGQPPEIGIGDGTQESGNYPFYSYYENNRTQMLYLGSEIGTGDVNIQEIALDFIQTDPEITSMTNLTINFLETTETEMGSAFSDMTGATNVLTASSFTMPQENGWFTFDIEDYIFDASNNLIVEIIWGDNGDYGSYDNYYKVNSTTTAFTSVAYGYADSETPPVYDGNSSVRPNIMLFIEGETSGTQYSRTFQVTDGTNPIEGAAISVGGYSLITNASGIATIDLYEGDYFYSAEAEGYETIPNTPLSVSGVGTTDILLNELNQYSVTFTVTDGINPLESATVYFAEESLSTNSSGVAVFSCFEGTYSYAVEMEGYDSFAEQSVTVDQDLNMDIVLEVIPEYNISFNISDGTNPLENAIVTFSGQTQITNSDGIAAFTSSDGVHQYSVEMEGYTPIVNHAIIVDQDIDMNISMEIIPVYTVNFTITDGIIALENAAVTFNGELQNTDASGIATFTCYEGSYLYSIQMEDYTPILNQALFVNHNMDMDITLDLIPIYNVTFTITDGTNPLENAEVTFDGVVQNTNNDGITTFTSYEGNYQYSIELENYASIIDQEITINEDSNINIALDYIGLYSVTFTITDGTNAIENASVTFNDITVNTDAIGEAEFEVYEGTYNCSIEASGFESILGESVSIDHDLEHTFVLTPVGIENSLSSEPVIYPNPTRNIVIIEYPGTKSGANVTIMDITGKSLIIEALEANKTIIDLNNISEGVYFIKIKNGTLTYFNKLIIK